MRTAQLIKQTMAAADHLLEHGVREVRLPLLLYRDWLEFYGLVDDGRSLERRRMEQKQDWYLSRFLRNKGASALFALIGRKTLLESVGEAEASIETDKEKRTFLNTLSQAGKGSPAPCKHSFGREAALALEPLVGTVTIFGEPLDGPEILSAVVHLKDGSPVAYENILASERSPQEAQQITMDFFDEYKVTEVFTTPGVHKPTFCEDCNELLVKVADPEEVSSILGKKL